MALNIKICLLGGMWWHILYQPPWRTPARTIHCLAKVNSLQGTPFTKTKYSVLSHGIFHQISVQLTTFQHNTKLQDKEPPISSASRLFGGTVSTAHDFISNTLWTGKVWEEWQNIIYYTGYTHSPCWNSSPSHHTVVLPQAQLNQNGS